jgi:hypothetical protein
LVYPVTSSTLKHMIPFSNTMEHFSRFPIEQSDVNVKHGIE